MKIHSLLDRLLQKLDVAVVAGDVRVERDVRLHALSGRQLE